MKIRTVNLPGYGPIAFVQVGPGSVPFLTASPVTRKKVGFELAFPAGDRHWSVTKPFYVSQLLVTKKLYAKVTGQAPWQARKSDYYSDDDRAPANFVSHAEAEEFCVMLGRAIGAKCALPSELEYELAASGGTGRDFYWYDGPWNEECERLGLDTSLYTSFTLERWLEPAAALVGTQKPNQYGVHDAIGLIREWVRDGYNDGPGMLVKEFADLPSVAHDVVFGPGPHRIAKGGPYFSDLSSVGRWMRITRNPEGRDESIGFRIRLDHA